MTITEKILSHASTRNKVSPGDIIFADVDKVMIHDVSGPGVIKVFKELEKTGKPTGKIWNPDKVWISEDHFVPASDKISADNVIQLTKWAQKNGIKKLIHQTPWYQIQYSAGPPHPDHRAHGRSLRRSDATDLAMAADEA